MIEGVNTALDSALEKRSYGRILAKQVALPDLRQQRANYQISKQHAEYAVQQHDRHLCGIYTIAKMNQEEMKNESRCPIEDGQKQPESGTMQAQLFEYCERCSSRRCSRRHSRA